MTDQTRATAGRRPAARRAAARTRSRPAAPGRLPDGNAVVVTLLALVVALVIGARPDRDRRPGHPGRGALLLRSTRRTPSPTRFSAIWHAYKALFEGAIFNPTRPRNGTLAGFFGPLSETLTNATPLILGGLSVGAGLPGRPVQHRRARARSSWARSSPATSASPGTCRVGPAPARSRSLAGMLGGALWGGLAGWLKAKTGAHEVITTIMLNYVALYLLGYLLSVKGFQAPAVRPGDLQRGRLQRAATRTLLGSQHAGPRRPDRRARSRRLVVWWLLSRSTLGFQLRAVGANQFAARTAGMSVARSYIIVDAASPARWPAWPARPDPRHQHQHHRRHRRRHRLRRDHGGAARPGQPGGTVLAGLLFGALQRRWHADAVEHRRRRSTWSRSSSR